MESVPARHGGRTLTTWPFLCLNRCAMNLETYRTRLQLLESDLARRLTRDIDTGRDVPNDQAEIRGPGHGRGDEGRILCRQRSRTHSSSVRCATRCNASTRGSYGRCVIDGGPIEEKCGWSRFRGHPTASSISRNSKSAPELRRLHCSHRRAAASLRIPADRRYTFCHELL